MILYDSLTFYSSFEFISILHWFKDTTKFFKILQDSARTDKITKLEISQVVLPLYSVRDDDATFLLVVQRRRHRFGERRAWFLWPARLVIGGCHV